MDHDAAVGGGALVEEVVGDASLQGAGDEKRSAFDEEDVVTVAAELMGEDGTGGAAADDEEIEWAIIGGEDGVGRGIVAEARGRKLRAMLLDPVVRGVAVEFDAGELLLKWSVGFRDVEIAETHGELAGRILIAGGEKEEDLLALRKSKSGKGRWTVRVEKCGEAAGGAEGAEILKGREHLAEVR